MDHHLCFMPFKLNIEKLEAMLNFQISDQAHAWRLATWPKLDINKNGTVTISEFTQYLVQALKFNDLFNGSGVSGANAIKMAMKAIGSTKPTDPLEFSQFRKMLHLTRIYAEVLTLHTELDVKNDKNLDHAEFDQALQRLVALGAHIVSAETELAKADKAKNGKISQAEYVDWVGTLQFDVGDDE